MDKLVDWAWLDKGYTVDCIRIVACLLPNIVFSIRIINQTFYKKKKSCPNKQIILTKPEVFINYICLTASCAIDSMKIG